MVCITYFISDLHCDASFTVLFLDVSVHFFAFCEIKIRGLKVLSLPKFSRKALIFNHGHFGLRGEVTVYPIQKKTKQNKTREKHDPALGRIG